jgi:hypothetical protein
VETSNPTCINFCHLSFKVLYTLYYDVDMKETMSRADNMYTCLFYIVLKPKIVRDSCNNNNEFLPDCGEIFRCVAIGEV